MHHAPVETQKVPTFLAPDYWMCRSIVHLNYKNCTVHYCFMILVLCLIITTFEH